MEAWGKKNYQSPKSVQFKLLVIDYFVKYGVRPSITSSKL